MTDYKIMNMVLGRESDTDEYDEEYYDRLGIEYDEKDSNRETHQQQVDEHRYSETASAVQERFFRRDPYERDPYDHPMHYETSYHENILRYSNGDGRQINTHSIISDHTRRYLRNRGAYDEVNKIQNDILEFAGSSIQRFVYDLLRGVKDRGLNLNREMIQYIYDAVSYCFEELECSMNIRGRIRIINDVLRGNPVLEVILETPSITGRYSDRDGMSVRFIIELGHLF